MRVAAALLTLALILAGCGRGESAASLAPTVSPIDESKYPKTIGPPTADHPAARLPPQKRMSKAEMIAEVKCRAMPPEVRARLLREIASPGAKPVRRRSGGPKRPDAKPGETRADAHPR